jgi:A/G-specific adenine glycosylase
MAQPRALNLQRAARQIVDEGGRTTTTLAGVGRTPPLHRCFAYGEDVPPVDVNVARVQRRTRHRFAPSSAQALMDLGATVCLARVPRCDACPLMSRCPSRGIRDEPARKQGSFEGSFRQRRAITLRLVADSKRALGELDAEAVRSLERDGLVVVSEGRVELPA